MKKVILVRHAKSSWEFNVSDRERPLKKRGINDAELVSLNFMKHSVNIDFVYTSPAKRAYSTCEIFTKNLDFPSNKIKGAEALYDFGGDGVVSFIKTLGNQLNTVMIFGHNHAFTSIVNLYGDRYIDNLPTSGLVLIAFDVRSWADVKHGQTKLVILPRDLK